MLSFIDLIILMMTGYDQQMAISTHDDRFCKLMRHKMPSEAINVKYYQIESYGRMKQLD